MCADHTWPKVFCTPAFFAHLCLDSPHEACCLQPILQAVHTACSHPTATVLISVGDQRYGDYVACPFTNSLVLVPWIGKKHQRFHRLPTCDVWLLLLVGWKDAAIIGELLSAQTCKSIETIRNESFFVKIVRACVFPCCWSGVSPPLQIQLWPPFEHFFYVSAPAVRCVSRYST